MQTACFSNKFIGLAAAVALCTSSTAAMAVSAPVRTNATISPLVALSALASDTSRAALCGAAAAAAAGAAALAQGAPQGCVLPVVDPAPVPVAEILPPPPVAPPPVAPIGGGFAISPLLLGLAAITAAVLLAVVLGKNKNSDSGSPA